MKAIETVYKGFRFRSRLEARWAIFYDAIKIKWEYEKEGFKFGKILYLPDFWLPEINGGGWIEIKGEHPTKLEQKKASKLALNSKSNVYIFYGQISDQANGNLSSEVFSGEGYWDNCQFWCQCRQCGKIGIQFEGRGARVCSHTDSDRQHNSDSPLLLKAYLKAQQARFEYGE